MDGTCSRNTQSAAAICCTKLEVEGKEKSSRATRTQTTGDKQSAVTRKCTEEVHDGNSHQQHHCGTVQDPGQCLSPKPELGEEPESTQV